MENNGHSNITITDQSDGQPKINPIIDSISDNFFTESVIETNKNRVLPGIVEDQNKVPEVSKQHQTYGRKGLPSWSVPQGDVFIESTSHRNFGIPKRVPSSFHQTKNATSVINNQNESLQTPPFSVNQQHVKESGHYFHQSFPSPSVVLIPKDNYSHTVDMDVEMNMLGSGQFAPAFSQILESPLYLTTQKGIPTEQTGINTVIPVLGQSIESSPSVSITTNSFGTHVRVRDRTQNTMSEPGIILPNTPPFSPTDCDDNGKTI